MPSERPAALAAAADAPRGGAVLAALTVLLLLGELLDLLHHLLARKVLLVALLEVEGAVVERLGVVLLVDLLPRLGALRAQLAPLLVLLLQPLEQRADRRGGALLQQLDDLVALRAVEAADRLQCIADSGAAACTGASPARSGR